MKIKEIDKTYIKTVLDETEFNLIVSIANTPDILDFVSEEDIQHIKNTFYNFGRYNTINKTVEVWLFHSNFSTVINILLAQAAVGLNLNKPEKTFFERASESDCKKLK